MHDVERAEALSAADHCGAAVIFHAHVTGHDGSLPAARLDLARGLFGGGLLAIEQQHASPLPREQDGGGAAVADVGSGLLAGAGDDRDLARQPALSAALARVALQRHRDQLALVPGSVPAASGGSGASPVVAIRRAMAM